MFCRMLKLKVLLEATTKAQLRALSTSAVRCGSDTAVVDQRFKDVHYPKVGQYHQASGSRIMCVCSGDRVEGGDIYANFETLKCNLPV